MTIFRRVAIACLIVASLALAAVFVTARSFEHGLVMAETRPAICLSDRGRQAIAAGKWSSGQQDALVVAEASFVVGVPPPTPPLWWHIREAAFQAVYYLFWSKTERITIFRMIVGKMRVCR